MTTRVLVAGGTGRLGTLLVAGLSSQQLEVRVMTRDLHRAAHLTREHVEVVRGDVRDPTSTAAAVAGVDVVVSAVHGLAGPGGVSPASVDRDGNQHLIDAARAVRAEFVLVSGVGAAPDSPLELLRMKHACERYLGDSGVTATVVRATAFMELWIELLRRTARRSHRPVVLGRGDNPINFVSVRDVAALVQRTVTDRTTRGRTLEIGGPDDLTLDELARLVAGDRVRGRPRHVPRAALLVLAVAASRLRPQLGRQARAALAMDSQVLTSDVGSGRAWFPGLPCTSVADLLG